MNKQDMIDYIDYALHVLKEHSRYDGDDGSAESDARDGLQLVLIALQGNNNASL